MAKCLKLGKFCNFASIIIFILFSVYRSFNVQINVSDLSNIDKMVKEAMQHDREGNNNNNSINNSIPVDPLSALNRLTEKLLSKKKF
jgi:hypothetical protein